MIIRHHGRLSLTRFPQLPCPFQHRFLVEFGSSKLSNYLSLRPCSVSERLLWQQRSHLWPHDQRFRASIRVGEPARLAVAECVAAQPSRVAMLSMVHQSFHQQWSPAAPVALAAVCLYASAALYNSAGKPCMSRGSASEALVQNSMHKAAALGNVAVTRIEQQQKTTSPQLQFF